MELDKVLNALAIPIHAAHVKKRPGRACRPFLASECAVLAHRPLACLLQQHRQRKAVLLHHLRSDGKLFDLLIARDVIHEVEHQLLKDHPQTARADLPLENLASDLPRSLIRKCHLHALEVEQLCVLLQDCIAWLGQNLNQRSLIQLVQNSEHRKSSDKLRNESILQQILRLGLTQQLRIALCPDRRHVAFLRIGVRNGLEAKRFLAYTSANHLLESDKSSAADKQNVRSIDSGELLVRMLAPTLRRNVSDRSFEQLQ